MADERIITELVVQGAQQSVQQILSVANAQTQLVTVQESAGVRQRQVYDSVARAAEASAAAQERAAKRAEAAAKATAATTTRASLAGSAPLGGLLQRMGPDVAMARAIQEQGKAAEVTAEQHAKKTRAIKDQASAEDSGSRQGITYLSVLSAIHAASFLATNRTFSLIGSFATLGLAFGKMGVAAGAVGLAFGGLLFIFGQVSQAMQQIQEAALSTVGVIAKVAVGIAAVGLAAASTGVKLAADVETQLAAVRAFGGATTEELKAVEAQANELAVRYGVAAADIVQATSLFARAGGTVKDALSGATEAIIKLQIASAGELSAAQSAIVLSAALKQFNLTGDQATRVADNLTAAFQGSALSALGVQQAFIQAAPGAAALGISIEQLSAAIALIGDRLVKGTITGTAFKQFILDIINPSKQAQAVMTQYGIAIKDVEGNLLPLPQILKNFNAALGDEAVEQGKVAQGARDTALAVIFGSRAFLAAEILTRGGADALAQYEEKLAAVATSNVVNVLLLPLNAQLERAKRAAEQLGQAFGGPLLGPIKDAVAAAIQFLVGLQPAAKLLGQIISVAVTGQGFGELEKKIQDISSNTAIQSFFTNLAATLLTVRDAIVGQILPAIQDFGTTIATAFNSSAGIDSVSNAFLNLQNSIRTIAAVLAIAIRNFGLLTVEFVNGTGRGGELRQQILDIATAIATNLVTNLATAAIFLTAAGVAMIQLGQIGLRVAQSLSSVFAVLADSLNIVGAAFDTLGLNAQKANITLALHQAVQANDAKTAERLQTELDNVNKQLADTGRRGPQETPAGRLAAELSNATAQAQQFSDELLRVLSPEAIQAQTDATLGVLREAGGSITDIFSNITAEVEQAKRDIAAGGAGGAPASPELIDQKAIDRAKERIAEAARDLVRRLDHLNEDIAQKTTNAVAKALEKIDDIVDKAGVSLGKLARETNERLAEIFDNINQRRGDRVRTDALRKQVEDNFTVFQRGLQAEEAAEGRSLEHRRTLRQRDNEDVARGVEQAFQATEKGYQRQQSAAERAFSLIQRAREIAFDRAAEVEERNFKRSQDIAAENRDFQKQFAKAKTPEDKAQLEKQRQEATQDRAFREQQETAFIAFRQQQEDKKRNFSDSAELQSIAFRQRQEDAFTEFRQKSELKILAFRRNAEDKETRIREDEEDAALGRRLAREDQLTERRRQDELAIRALQDTLEDEAAKRQANKIIRDAQEKAADIVKEATRQVGEVLDAIQLQVDEQAADVEKQIRNVIDTFKDMADSIPPELLQSVLGNLATVEATVNRRAQEVRANLQGIRDDAQQKIEQKAAVANAQLLLSVPPDLQTQIQQQIPTSVITAQQIIVGSLLLPPGFSQVVGDAFLFAVRQAANEGLLSPDVNVDLEPLDDTLQGLRRMFGRA